MRSALPVLLVGVATGSIYSIAALGLVLTYKTSGIFNFGHGALATVGAYLFFELWVRQGVPWPIAAILDIAVVAMIAGVGMEWLARSLLRAPMTLRVVATVGLLLAIQGAAVLRYGAASRSFPPFLPTSAVRFMGVNVGVDQLLLVGVAAVMASMLFAFFRYTRLGVAMRAAVDDVDLLGLDATNPISVRRSAWVIGSAFAAASGILLTPLLGLDATILTLLVVQAFGAAAIGGFTSLPMTYVGGLVVGVGAAIFKDLALHHPALAGVPASFPFLALFVVLLFFPKSRLQTMGTTQSDVRAGHALLTRQPSRLPLLVGFGALALVPTVVGSRLPVYTDALAVALLLLSLSVLVRLSGQISLCQMGFAAIGAASFSHFAVGAGLPWPLAVLAAGLVTVPAGLLIAVPAIRLSGLYLALTTLGFGILLERLLYGTPLLFGDSDFVTAPRPHLAALRLDSGTGYYFVVLAALTGAVVLILAIQGGRLGALLGALGQSPVALTTLGTNTNLTRMIVFSLSAFLAGIAGALRAPITQSTSSTSFPALQSLLLVVVLAVSGSKPIRAALIASALLVVAPAYLGGATTVEYQPIVFGALAIAASVTAARYPDAIGRVRSKMSQARGRSLRSPIRERLALAALTRAEGK